MPIVSIRHLTRYRYRTRVGFGEHRMMLRPLEAFDQRLISYALEISPEPSSLHHLHDLTDACVAVARFDAGADALVVESRALIEHAPVSAPRASDGAASRPAALPMRRTRRRRWRPRSRRGIPAKPTTGRGASWGAGGARTPSKRSRE